MIYRPGLEYVKHPEEGVCVYIRTYVCAKEFCDFSVIDPKENKKINTTDCTIPWLEAITAEFIKMFIFLSQRWYLRLHISSYTSSVWEFHCILPCGQVPSHPSTLIFKIQQSTLKYRQYTHTLTLTPCIQWEAGLVSSTRKGSSNQNVLTGQVEWTPSDPA